MPKIQIDICCTINVTEEQVRKLMVGNEQAHDALENDLQARLKAIDWISMDVDDYKE